MCGCGKEANIGRKFISGHNARVPEFASGQFKKGNKPWDIGMTKETNPIVAAISKKAVGRKYSMTQQRIQQLTNLHNRPVSEETRKKISLSLRGERNGFWRKTLSSASQLKRLEKLIKPRENRFCVECNKVFTVIATSSRKYCCFECYAQNRIGRKYSDEYRKNISKATIGHKVSDEVRQRIRLKKLGTKLSIQTREKQSKSQIERCKNDPTLRLKRRENAIRNMQNPDFVKRVFARREMSGPEKVFLNICKEYNFPFQYNGNLNNHFLIIDRKIPDFVHNSEKKLIEIWGDFYHKGQNPEDRINFFRQRGYDCIVIWASELNKQNNILNRVLCFTGGD